MVEAERKTVSELWDELELLRAQYRMARHQVVKCMTVEVGKRLHLLARTDREMQATIDSWCDDE